MSLVNEKQFTCWYCKRTLPFIRKDEGHVTQNIGFVVSSMGQHCYDCQARFDAAQMMKDSISYQYLVPVITNPLAPYWKEWRIRNYSVTMEFRIPSSPYKSKHNLAGHRYDVWFTGPDGAKWHAVAFGQIVDGCLVKCTRLKQQKKGLTLVNENFYLKPFDYTKLK